MKLIRKLIWIVALLALMLSITPIPVLASDAADPGLSQFEEVVDTPPLIYVGGEPLEPTYPDPDVDNGAYILDGGKSYYSIYSDEEIELPVIIMGSGEYYFTQDFNSSSSLYVLNGSLNTYGFDVTAESIYMGEYNDITPILVDIRGSIIDCNVWAVRGDGVGLVTDNSTINTNLMFDDSDKSGRVYDNVNLSDRESESGKLVYAFMEGKNSINKLVIESKNGAYVNDSITAKEFTSDTAAIKTNNSELVTITVQGKTPQVLDSIGILNDYPVKSSTIYAGSGVGNIISGSESGLYVIEVEPNREPVIYRDASSQLYWVGGTGLWSDTGHWSLASGGAGGHDVPTATNNVDFDANSFTGAGQIVTIDADANCCDMDWTGATNNPTLAGSGAINVYGDIIFIAAMNMTEIGKITAKANCTLTTYGLSISCGLIASGSGVTLTLADDLTSASYIKSEYAAIFVTGNHNITCKSIVSGNGSTWTLGSSIIACSVVVTETLTVTDNTATINITGTGALTAGDVNYNGASFNLNGTAHTVSGSFTCANLTRTGTATKTDSVTFTSGTTVTVTDTLTLAGNSATNRLLVQSSTLGSAATLNAATVSVSNADFMDITGAGAGSWDLSGATGGSGDCGGNTDITFTAPATQTSTKAGNWSDATMWTSRVPLPQDDVNCSHNVTVDMPRIGKSVTFTGTPTVTLSNDASCYGSLTLAVGMTYAPGSNRNYFRGRGSYTITSSGNIISSIGVTAPGGTLTFNDDAAVSSRIVLFNGGIDFNDKNITTSDFQSGYSTVRSLYLGNGTITLKRASSIDPKLNISSVNLTFDAEASTIILTNSTANAQTFDGGGLTYNNVTVAGAGNYNLTITGDNTFNTFEVDASQAAKTITATGTTQTVNDFTRDEGGTNVISLTDGTWTKSDATPIALDYLTVTNSTASPADTWYAGSNSTDGTGNTDWIFDDPALTVTTQAATGVTMDADGVTGGTLHGTITTDLDGTPYITTYFEYGLTAAYGSQTADVMVYDDGTFTGTIPATLTPGETYHFRAVATNGNAGSPFNGADDTFVFTMPTVTTTAPSVAAGEYTLSGTIDDMGVSSNCYVYFEYGPTTAYGNTTTPQIYTTPGTFNATITDIVADETIYFRAVANCGDTVSNGDQASFNTIANIRKYFGFREIALLIPMLLGALLLVFGIWQTRTSLASNYKALGMESTSALITGILSICIGIIMISIVIGVIDMVLAL